MDSIMGAVVALIVLSVGIFAFFSVSQSIPTSVPLTNETGKTLKDISMNISSSADSIFNIIGVVLIIGVVMSVVGIVYGYVSDHDYVPREERHQEEIHVEPTKRIIVDNSVNQDESFKKWKEKHPELYNKKE